MQMVVVDEDLADGPGLFGSIDRGRRRQPVDQHELAPHVLLLIVRRAPKPDIDDLGFQSFDAGAKGRAQRRHTSTGAFRLGDHRQR